MGKCRIPPPMTDLVITEVTLLDHHHIRRGIKLFVSIIVYLVIMFYIEINCITLELEKMKRKSGLPCEIKISDYFTASAAFARK